MARLTLQLLPLILSVLYIAGTAEPHTPVNFIEASCSGTSYPAVCVRSLSCQANAVQQSPHKLAQAALTVSQAMAESTKANMLKLTNLTGLKPAEFGALKDCLDQIQESVDRLRQSNQEMEQLSHVKGETFLWYKKNVETWITAALTEINTCGSKFSSQALDGKIKASVQGQITNVEQLVSIALALFQQFVATH